MTDGRTGAMGRVLALVLLVVMGAMWGLQFAMLKLAAAGGHSELSVLMCALVLLSMLFLAIALATRSGLALNRGRVVFLVVTGIAGYIAPLLATLYASAELSAGMLTLIASLSPVVAVVVALALRTERVSLARALGVALGLVSVAVIVAPELTLPGLGKAPWMLIAFVVPLAYGFESVYIARAWPAGLSPLSAVTLETIAATIMVAPLFIWTGEALPGFGAWGASEAAIGVFVGAGVVESLLYFYLIRHTGGVFVNFGSFVSLFAGLAWGIVIFSESHAWTTWLAAGALVGALYLSVRDPLHVTGRSR